MLCQNEVITQALCLLGYDADDSGGQPYTRLWTRRPPRCVPSMPI